MYVQAFGAKIRIFFEGGAPFWPPQKFVEKNQKNIFALYPQFFILQSLILEQLRCLQKTRARKNEN